MAYLMRDRVIRERNLFLAFATVGALGTLVNLLVFFITADLGGLNANVCSIASFFVAVTFNYVLNNNWTFREKNGTFFSARAWPRYIAVNLFGLAVNLLVLNGAQIMLAPPLAVISQGAGIAAGMLFNYFFSRILVFRTRFGQ